MGSASPALWLRPVAVQGGDGQAGCGGCMPSDSRPVCRVHLLGGTCAQPQLAGRAEQVSAVLRALDCEVVDPDARRGIVDLQWVQALRISDDEVELTLSFAGDCGPGRQLADGAFRTLRRLLPDTDIYVRHAA